MIQRIQTVYLAIVIILLSIVTFGSTLFSFVNEELRFSFTSFGISGFDLESGKLVQQQNFPIYAALIALILLACAALFSYKNLSRQFRLGRALFAFYFLVLIAVIVLSAFGDGLLDVPAEKREMGLGFFLLVAGFPFTFLANLGIKRDKKLLESLDRLR